MNKNNTKYLNLKTVLPKKSRSGITLNIIYRNNKLFVDYPILTRQVKSIVPGKLTLNNDFFIGYGLSIGDGLNNPSIRNTHYNFSNSDFRLVYIVYCWLKRNFGIKDHSFQFFLFQKNVNSKPINIIKKLFRIKESRIKIYQSNRHRKDVLTLQISNPIFQLIYLNLFDILKNRMITNMHYRRSFLKGLFAAEGHIKHSIYNTIESISFSFNPKKEKNLAEFILKCLNKESVNAKIWRDIVYFCGYHNMIKIYLTGILSLHKNKKNKFLKLIRHKNYNLYFDRGSLKFLRKHSQSKLSKEIGCSQSGICKMLNGDYMNTKTLEKFENKDLIKRKNLLNKIKYIGVSSSYIKDKESVDFLINKIIL